MTKLIVWETDLAAAVKKAKAQGKTVLLDFHNPH